MKHSGGDFILKYKVQDIILLSVVVSCIGKLVCITSSC